ncbi:MAG: Gfo/Idh/MocA family oxidoreductase [Ruminococcaceae bacterium]|nr:Gfo/Idh/MocA family oxidoreductase [Oscillospiraceae bacterium]
MRTIKFGVFGLGRGSSFYENILLNNGEVVAVCDMSEEKLADAKAKLGNDVATYTDFDSFINHKGLEAVFLCNYFHEHAPYAIKALKKNIHVLSECTSNGTMAEGVELVRAAEESKAIYMISENYPFMIFNLEMRRVYQSGSLGKLLFAEGEYNHPVNPENIEECTSLIPYGKHWRMHLPRTYYITHSLAPLMYMTGATPVRVTAMPVFHPFTDEEWTCKCRVGDRAAIITCLNDDDSVFRVTGCAAFGAHENSYRLCGDKGQIENIRGEKKVLLRYNSWNIPEGGSSSSIYQPSWNDKDAKLIEKSGHGGGDFLVIREFFNCIRENKQPTFDVYFATTMASVAILSHRSLLERGVPYDIPDFRKEEDKQKYENDRLTPFWSPDGSAPTIADSSHPDKAPTEEDMAEYDRKVAEYRATKK